MKPGSSKMKFFRPLFVDFSEKINLIVGLYKMSNKKDSFVRNRITGCRFTDSKLPELIMISDENGFGTYQYYRGKTKMF